MSFNKFGYYTRDEENFSFHYKTDLTMIEKIDFVNTVTAYIVGNNYNYIAKDLFFDFEIIAKFTDYDLDEIREAKDSISLIEVLLSETNIVDVVKESMSPDLLEELYKSVSLNVEYKTGIHNDTTKNAFASVIKVIEDKINSVDIEALTQFIKLFTEHINDFTPDKILEAYEKSDLYKKRMRKLEKIQEDKMSQTLQEIKRNAGLKVLNKI